MKKTYYLFNPGRLSRKDNTLVFVPMDETGNEQQPRYIPVEMVDQLDIPVILTPYSGHIDPPTGSWF